ncbi:MAG TPA: hypothetical protein VKR61_23385 [Bryobacteraceae bacterium]|nr:hypothetical protein [Bryobacteraceae bacterium]
MGHYPFTLFNGISLLMLALTIAVVWQRFRGRPGSNWPLLYYAAIGGYTLGFSGGLHPWWVMAGAACAAAIRFGLYAATVRLVELVPLGYVAWRLAGLVLMW